VSREKELILSWLCTSVSTLFGVKNLRAPLVFAKRTKNPPHILLVVADDLGWSNVGYHGSKIKTPNIDKLASKESSLTTTTSVQFVRRREVHC